MSRVATYLKNVINEMALKYKWEVLQTREVQNENIFLRRVATCSRFSLHEIDKKKYFLNT